VAVKIEGGYHNIASFLNELAQMTRVVNVRNLEIEEMRGNENAKYPAQAKFTAVTYTLGVDPSLLAEANGDAGAAGVARISRPAPSHGRGGE